MKIRKKMMIWSLVGVITMGIGGGAYGIAYHTGAEPKIEQSVVTTYDKIQNSVVTGYEKVQDGVVNEYQHVENSFVSSNAHADANNK